MRKEAAFQFIPELIGDFNHVMELSANPQMLYIETAINSLHMVVDVFSAITEYINTQEKKTTEKEIHEKYDKLKNKRLINYEEEAIQKLDVSYERVKSKIRDRHYQDKEVREFIHCLQSHLKKMIELLKNIQTDPDYPEPEKNEEMARKTLRDYNKLLSLFIEEKEKDGQDKSK